MTTDMAVVTPLNNFLGPEGDTVTVDELLLNTQYSRHRRSRPLSTAENIRKRHARSPRSETT